MAKLKHMVKKANNIFIYVLSVGLVIAAIAVTAIINSANKGNNVDVRARAGTAVSLKLVGYVSNIDSVGRIVQVDNLNFLDKPATPNLGSWQVVAPANLDISALYAGEKVTVAVDSATFVVTNHSVTALEIAPAK